MKRREFTRLAMGSSLGLAATPLVLKSAHAAEPYRLGAVQALTGTGSVSSKHSLNGIELAVEEINRDGIETLGRKFAQIHATVRDAFADRFRALNADGAASPPVK